MPAKLNRESKTSWAFQLSFSNYIRSSSSLLRILLRVGVFALISTLIPCPYGKITVVDRKAQFHIFRKSGTVPGIKFYLWNFNVIHGERGVHVRCSPKQLIARLLWVANFKAQRSISVIWQGLEGKQAKHRFCVQSSIFHLYGHFWIN